MKDTLAAGLEYEFNFVVPETKTVPYLFPEATEFAEMPKVLATGFLVGLVEWTCIQSLSPYIDWPKEQTVGTRIDLKHMAATPPGLTVTVSVRLAAVENKRLVFEFTAHDGVDRIAEGTHERFVINAGRFNEKLQGKAAGTGRQP